VMLGLGLKDFYVVASATALICDFLQSNLHCGPTIWQMGRTMLL